MDDAFLHNIGFLSKRKDFFVTLEIFLGSVLVTIPHVIHTSRLSDLSYL